MSDQLSSDLASLRIDRSEDPERRGSLVKLLVVVALIGALSAAGVVFYPRLEGMVFKTPVTTGPITLVSPVQESIKVTSTGYVVPQTRSDVGAKVPGRVAQVHIKEGDVVEKGQLLVELEDADARSAISAANSKVSTAMARVAVAKANLDEGKLKVKREKILVEKGASPAANLEDLEARQKALEASLRAAQTTVAAARKEVETLQVGLADRTIKAPIGGTIVNKPVEAGELVGVGAPIARIADFDSMMVETDVPEGRLHMVQPGSPCEIVLDAYPTKRYRGETVELGKQVNRAKATVTVRVKFSDELTGVLPDMSARVSFLSQKLSKKATEEPAKLVVPADAVVERDGMKVVFAVEDGVARRVNVHVGEPYGGGLQLLNGPRAGARVVLKPPATLKDGQALKEKSD